MPRPNQQILAVLLLLVGVLVVAVYFFWLRETDQRQGFIPTPRPTLDLATPTFQKTWAVETILSGVHLPSALLFLPDGRWLYTENQRGNIRMVDAAGNLLPDSVISLPVTSTEGEGLLGMALDPDFANNHFIWLYYTQAAELEPPYPHSKLVRFELNGTVGENVQEMFSIPITTGATIHNGGGIVFGADGYLYLSVGEFNNPAFSQERDGLAGRLHRFEVDNGLLRPAPDNPFPDNSTYAYGLRNPFSFDFDPISGELFLADNGPDCDDEINWVLSGLNYGWRPDYPCDDIAPQDATSYTYPVWFLRRSEGISGMVFYDGAMFPDWYGDILFCAWNFGTLRRAELNESRTLVNSVRRIPIDDGHCAIDIEVAPDGSIYFTDAATIYRLYKSE